MTAGAGPIVWLASYPKSGNTWVRALLTACLDGDVALDSLGGAPIVRNRAQFDDATGMASADMHPDELDLYRPDFHRAIAEQVGGPFFIKIHDAWGRNAHGEAVFPGDASRGAIYLVRDPRDVACSFADHRGEDVSQVIALMASREAALNLWPNRIGIQLPERLSSWSGNVESWLDRDEMPVLLVRYEDLLADTPGEFSRILRFAGIEADAGQIAHAVESASFDRLQHAEAQSGFPEKAQHHKRFFRSGQAEGWRETLSGDQAARIVADHGKVMRRMGYLDALPLSPGQSPG